MGGLTRGRAPGRDERLRDRERRVFVLGFPEAFSLNSTGSSLPLPAVESSSPLPATE